MKSGILAIFPPNSEGAKTVLLHLAWRAGSDPAKDNYRSSYQKQKNSAEQIGCSRETYSRRVEYLRKLGILRTKPHTPGRPLLDTKIVEYTELRNIAERFGKHGAPPMKNDNSFSRSRLSRDNRVTRGSHRQPSQPIWAKQPPPRQASAPVQPRKQERSAFEQAREECLDFEALLLLPQYLPELCNDRLDRRQQRKFSRRREGATCAAALCYHNRHGSHTERRSYCLAGERRHIGSWPGSPM